MESPLKKEFEYYLANQSQLVAKYNGRFVVIKDQRVIGDYSDLPTAVTETTKTHQLEPSSFRKLNLVQARTRRPSLQGSPSRTKRQGFESAAFPFSCRHARRFCCPTVC